MKLAIVVCAGVSVRGAVGWCCPETLRISWAVWVIRVHHR